MSKRGTNKKHRSFVEGAKVRALWQNEDEKFLNPNNWYKGSIFSYGQTSSVTNSVTGVIQKTYRCDYVVSYYDGTEQRHKISNDRVISDVPPSQEELLAKCSRNWRKPGVVLCAKHPKFDSECFYRAELVTMFMNRHDWPLKLRFSDDGEELDIDRSKIRLLSK